MCYGNIGREASWSRSPPRTTRPAAGIGPSLELALLRACGGLAFWTSARLSAASPGSRGIFPRPPLPLRPFLLRGDSGLCRPRGSHLDMLFRSRGPRASGQTDFAAASCRDSLPCGRQPPAARRPPRRALDCRLSSHIYAFQEVAFGVPVDEARPPGACSD
jgi:hypothetical protein